MSQGLKDRLLEELWEHGDWDGNQDDYGITWCPEVIYEDDETYGEIAGYYIAEAHPSGLRTLIEASCETDMDHMLERLDARYSEWLLAEDV